VEFGIESEKLEAKSGPLRAECTEFGMWNEEAVLSSEFWVLSDV
jgi:hypothetical protein